MGSKQQQVTTYAHKDENNVMKKWNEEPPNNTDIDAVIDLQQAITQQQQFAPQQQQ
jgi:dolichyl-phosphate-mannose--protein O-mannosyl transferase